MFDRRREFVMLALGAGANVRELCRRFGVSPPTGYKWIRRYQENVGEVFADRSRRPVHSPGKLCSESEAQIVALRQRHPRWELASCGACSRSRGASMFQAPAPLWKSFAGMVCWRRLRPRSGRA